MEIISKDKLIEGIRTSHGKSRMLPTNGWAQPVIKHDVNEKPAHPQALTVYIEETFEFTIERRVITERGNHVSAKGAAAEAIFREMYGDLIVELEKIHYLIMNSDQDESRDRLSALIHKLR